MIVVSDHIVKKNKNQKYKNLKVHSPSFCRLQGIPARYSREAGKAV